MSLDDQQRWMREKQAADKRREEDHRQRFRQDRSMRKRKAAKHDQFRIVKGSIQPADPAYVSQILRDLGR
jgi:hypothetical protein